MNKKIKSLIAVLIALTIVLVGCGPKELTADDFTSKFNTLTSYENYKSTATGDITINLENILDIAGAKDAMPEEEKEKFEKLMEKGKEIKIHISGDSLIKGYEAFDAKKIAEFCDKGNEVVYSEDLKQKANINLTIEVFGKSVEGSFDMVMDAKTMYLSTDIMNFVSDVAKTTFDTISEVAGEDMSEEEKAEMLSEKEEMLSSLESAKEMLGDAKYIMFDLDSASANAAAMGGNPMMGMASSMPINQLLSFTGTDFRFTEENIKAIGDIFKKAYLTKETLKEENGFIVFSMSADQIFNTFVDSCLEDLVKLVGEEESVTKEFDDGFDGLRNKIHETADEEVTKAKDSTFAMGVKDDAMNMSYKINFDGKDIAEYTITGTVENQKDLSDDEFKVDGEIINIEELMEGIPVMY